jgi:serine/threonine protein kinase
MLEGKTPWTAAREYDIFSQITACEYTFPDHFSEDAKDLISKLLIANPLKRFGYGPNGFENLKNHSFFKDIDF